MKKSFILLSAAFFLLLSVSVSYSHAQSVAVNEDGSQPHPSAILDIQSTTKGLLIPRMSSVQRDEIVSPSIGLIVFDTDLNAFQFYDGVGWIQMATGASTNFWSLNGPHIFNTNTGNIGIGTSNPAYKFTLQSLTNDYGWVHTDGTVTLGTYVGGSAGGGWIGTISNHPFHIYTNNGSAQVSFKTDFGMDLKGNRPYIQWYDGNTVSGYIQSNSIDLELAGRKVFLGGTPGNLILQADDITNPIFASQYAGNVGIGTKTPVGKLHINHPGPAAHVVLEHPVLNNYSSLLFTNTGANRYWGIAGKTGTGNLANDRMTFFNNANGFEGIIITGDGYVSIPGQMGIGTFNTAYKFAVNGSIRSKEVVVESGWADYVFDKGYRLLSLDEVEKFIQQNKHLPNIPSAKEIEEKGLSIGDTQKRMMEKIEELTLYILELKKEIDILKAAKRDVYEK